MSQGGAGLNGSGASARWDAEAKAQVVLAVLKSQRRVQDLCDDYGIHPSTYSKWKRCFIDGGIQGLRGEKNGASSQEKLKITELEEKINVYGAKIEFLRERAPPDKKKNHINLEAWAKLFRAIQERDLPVEAVRKSLDIPSSTFYRKMREHMAGGVRPRRKSGGREQADQSLVDMVVRECLRGTQGEAGSLNSDIVQKKQI